MPTVSAEDNTTADGSEQTLWDVTSNKFFFGFVSLENMQAGDTMTLRRYIKVRSTGGSSLQLEWSETYTDANTGRKVIYLAPIPSDVEYKLTLQQTAGTNRSYAWKLYEA